jgi:hypothetical protein
MSFVDKDTLNPSCYWHATIEELREEPGRRGKVCPQALSFFPLRSMFFLGLGKSEVVLEESRLR